MPSIKQNGISDLGLEVKSAVLVCDKNNLIDRWKNDKTCEWRTEEWLEVSLTSLLYFSSLENRIDTSDLTVDLAADLVMRQSV